LGMRFEKQMRSYEYTASNMGFVTTKSFRMGCSALGIVHWVQIIKRPPRLLIMVPSLLC
jgi:hypothetical protein